VSSPYGVIDGVIIVLGVSLTALIVTEIRWVEVTAVSLMVFCALALLVDVMRRLSNRMVRRMSDPPPEIDPEAFTCIYCGQVVTDEVGHWLKSHGKTAS